MNMRLLLADGKNLKLNFDYADNIKQAAAMLSFKEYICVAICSDVIPQDDFGIFLRQKRAYQLLLCHLHIRRNSGMHVSNFGAAQYLHTYNHPMVEMIFRVKIV